MIPYDLDERLNYEEFRNEVRFLISEAKTSQDYFTRKHEREIQEWVENSMLEKYKEGGVFDD